MRKTVYWIFLFLLLFPVGVFATVCRLPGLSGYDDAAARAGSVLPPKTHDISKLAIYVEVDPNGGFYFHSNFISEGHDNPTKIGGEPTLDTIEWAAQNLVWTSSPTPSEREQVQSSINLPGKIYIDKRVFKEDGTSDLNLDGISEFTIIDRESQSSIAGILIKRDAPPPILAERIAGCCLNGRPIGKGSMLALALTSLKSSPKDTRIISLVADSATVNTVNEVGLSKKATMVSGDASSSMDQIREAFEQQAGKQLVVLGHVESGSFVVRDSSGNQVTSVAIQDLRSLAAENNVLLIEIGCNTASVGDASSAADAGVLTRFNTVEAVQKLSKAVEANNLSEFFERLADEDLKVVVQSEAVEKIIRYRAEYFAKDEIEDHDVLVAQVSVTAREGGLFGSWTPNWMRQIFR